MTWRAESTLLTPLLIMAASLCGARKSQASGVPRRASDSANTARTVCAIGPSTRSACAEPPPPGSSRWHRECLELEHEDSRDHASRPDHDPRDRHARHGTTGDEPQPDPPPP